MSFKFLSAALAFTVLLQACNNESQTTAKNTDSATTTDNDKTKTMNLEPKGPKPDWAPNIDDEMLVIIEKLQSYGTPPLETLTPQEARKQPTPTTAVTDVMKEHNIPIPLSKVDTMGKEIPVSGGSIHARIYTPQTGDSSYPVIVYYHGGGWVIADLDVYDGGPRALAEQVNAVVVSVHYRQGPEHKFPTAHNDAFAAYQWVLKKCSFYKRQA